MRRAIFSCIAASCACLLASCVIAGPVTVNRDRERSIYAKVEKAAVFPNSALKVAAASYDLELAELALAKGASPKKLMRKGNLYEASRGDASLAKRLIEYGADPGILDTEGKSSLILAIENGNDAFVDALLESGVSANKEDARGVAPLFFALRGKWAAIARSLLENGAVASGSSSSGEGALAAAAALGDPALIPRLVAAGADIRQVDREGRTAIASAIRAKAADEYIFGLLEAGVDPGRPDAMGVTPMMLSLENERKAIAMRLLESGVAASGRGTGGAGALALAAALDDAALIPRLVAAGADVAQVDDGGRTALVAAIISGAGADYARGLIKAGVDPGRADAKSGTALISALEKGQAETAAAILEAGADAGGRSLTGAGAVELAVTGPKALWPLIPRLVKAGASTELRDGAGYTPLQRLLSVGSKDIELVRALLAAGAYAGFTEAGGAPSIVVYCMEYYMKDSLEVYLSNTSSRDNFSEKIITRYFDIRNTFSEKSMAIETLIAAISADNFKWSGPGKPASAPFIFDRSLPRLFSSMDEYPMTSPSAYHVSAAGGIEELCMAYRDAFEKYMKEAKGTSYDGNKEYLSHVKNTVPWIEGASRIADRIVKRFDGLPDAVFAEPAATVVKPAEAASERAPRPAASGASVPSSSKLPDKPQSFIGIKSGDKEARVESIYGEPRGVSRGSYGKLLFYDNDVCFCVSADGGWVTEVKLYPKGVATIREKGTEDELSTWVMKTKKEIKRHFGSPSNDQDQLISYWNTSYGTIWFWFKGSGDDQPCTSMEVKWH